MKNSKNDYALVTIVLVIALFGLIFIWLLISKLMFGVEIKENFDVHPYFVAGVGLFGTVLGGIISGGLTYFGVEISLRFEREKVEKEKIPHKLQAIDSIINLLESNFKHLDMMLEIVEIKELREVNFILKKYDKISLEIKKYASLIGTDIYKENLNLIDKYKIVEKNIILLKFMERYMHTESKYEHKNIEFVILNRYIHDLTIVLKDNEGLKDFYELVKKQVENKTIDEEQMLNGFLLHFFIEEIEKFKRKLEVKGNELIKYL